MPRLVIKKPLGPATEMPLSLDAYSLGRATDNHIVLEGSLISRRHGHLRREGAGFRIADTGSHNGIYVNGLKIEEAELKDADEIRIGNYLLTYRTDDGRPQVTGPVETVTVEADYDRVVSELTMVSRRPVTPSPQTDIRLESERERRTLPLLYELSRALSTVRSIDEVSRKALELLFETTQAERAAVFLMESPESPPLPRVVLERGNARALPGPVTISSTVAQRILTERKGIITADAKDDPRFAAGMSVVMSGLRSIACAPLIGQGGTLGILYMENNRSIGAFSQDDLELLCAVASQLALSAENARFFEALQQANEALEAKVEERTAELRESELKRYQAEKMASLSRLVAGVAHEINNPLGALKGNLEIVTVLTGRLATAEGRTPKEVQLLEQLAKLGHESAAACGRILGVVRSLRSFARLDEAGFKMANVNEGLEAAVRLLDPATRQRVEVVVNLGEIPPIPCFPALLNEAFMNLLFNACQAIKQKGQVFLSTRREGEEVVVEFRDTGAGIPREHLSKIFEPGFTTKGVGVGVGLGLPIVHRVVEEHRGTIHVASEPGQGSTFTVRLPIALDKQAGVKSVPS
jgi:signal transduction histidine kinase